MDKALMSGVSASRTELDRSRFAYVIQFDFESFQSSLLSLPPCKYSTFTYLGVTLRNKTISFNLEKNVMPDTKNGLRVSNHSLLDPSLLLAWHWATVPILR